MFSIDITLEDSRLTATSSNGEDWICTSRDNLTGREHHFACSNQAILAIINLAVDYNGMPEGHEKFYALAEPLFKDVPIECRFIP